MRPSNAISPLVLVTSLTCLVVNPTLFAEEVVYYAYTGSYNNISSELGTQIVLEGTERIVVRAGFIIYPLAYLPTTEVQMRFYANDGPDGEPSTLIWDSGIMDFGPGDESVPQYAQVTVPDVIVPDSLTVTLMPHSGQILLATAGTADVGTTVRGWNHGTTWIPQTINRTRGFDLSARQGSGGSVRLNRETYLCSQSVNVSVRDDDLAAGPSPTVTVATSGGDSETVVLIRSQPGKGIFGKTLATSTAAVVVGDGILQIGHGQVIEATYEDASGAEGLPVTVQDTATLDCQPPVISNVQISQRGHIVDVTFDTNEPATPSVRFGTSCGSLDRTITGAAGETTHALALPTIEPSEVCYFQAQAVDAVGNIAFDDNGGVCYVVTPLPVQTLFIETFPSPSIDPTNWSSVSGSAVIDSSGSPAPSPPYSLHFPQFSPESTVESRTFDLRDKSGLEIVFWFKTDGTDSTGFDPVVGLTMEYWSAFGHWESWLLPAGPSQGMIDFDRIVAPLPLDAYHDGFRFRLRPFQSIDTWWADDLFIQQGPPAPPTVQEDYVTVCGDAPTTLTLVAGDDGRPDPPSALDYVITALPTHGVLSDPQTGPILDVPYTLLNHGNQVVFVRQTGHTGEDRLNFKAGDGGVAPDGGESPIATVALDVVSGPPGMTADPVPANGAGKVSVSTTLSWAPAPLDSNGHTVEVDIPDATEEFSGGNRLRGNYFTMSEDATLTEIQMELDFTVQTTLAFVVYVCDNYSPPTRIAKFDRVMQGTGRGFYSSGPVSVPLSKGKDYVIGVAWAPPDVRYYRVSEGYPKSFLLGVIQGGVGPDDLPFPPPVTLYFSLNSPQAYSGRFSFLDERPACPVTYRVLMDAVNPPTTVVCDEMSEPTCDPGPLVQNQRYYWQVIARHSCGDTAGPIWQFITSLPPDHDDDGDIDQADFGYLQQCVSGTGVTQTRPDCFDVLLDDDDDVDAADMATLLGCLSGAGVQADPACLP